MNFDFQSDSGAADLGFSGNRIDRDAEHRGETALDDALADPRATILLFAGGRLLLALAEGEASCRFQLAAARHLGTRLAEAVLLGHDASGPVLAAALPIPEHLPEGLKAVDLRSVNSQGLLGVEDLGAAAQGAALLSWNANCRFCGRCGAATMAQIGGYRRACSECGTHHFPRTDPVVIMLTVRGGHCLLGRSPHFAPGIYSALAGFVEPGETIEDAVRRETREEAGIRIGRVAYAASQPWPFPHSLMIGCFAEALDEDVTPDFAELEDCRWFSRAEVATILGGSHPNGFAVPPKAAIAHHLIATWARG